MRHDLDEIIFEHLNRDYGAYKLRKAYPNNVIIGCSASSLLVVSLFAYPLIFRLIFKKGKTTETEKTVVFEPLPELPAPPLGSVASEKRNARSRKSKSQDKILKPLPKELTDVKNEIQEIGPDGGDINQEGTVDNGAGSLIVTGTVAGKESSLGEGSGDFDPNKLYGKVYYLEIPNLNVSQGGGEIELIFKADMEREIELNIKKGILNRISKFIKVTIEKTDKERIVNTDMWQISEGVGYIHKHQYQSFVRVNNHTAVNIINIQSVKKDEITLNDGTKIALKNQYRDLLRDRLAFYTSAYGGDTITFEPSPIKRKHFAYQVKGDSSNHASVATDRVEFSLGIAETKFALSFTLQSEDLSEINARLDARLEKFRRDSEIEKLQKIIADRKLFEARKNKELEAIKFNRPYGTADRTVKIDEKMAAFRTVAEALGSGRVPGIIVSGNDIYLRSAGVMTVDDPSNPGQTMKRGGLSLGGGEDPLYLLDGLPSTKEVVLSLPISSVEAIDILNSADNTALYGSRGANGVISVLTKK